MRKLSLLPEIPAKGVKMETIEWVIAVLAFICVCTNSYCLYYVIKTFNLKQCLNYIMCIDSSVAAISSGMIFNFHAVGIQNFPSWNTFQFSPI